MALWGAPIAHEDDADRAMRLRGGSAGRAEKLNVKWKNEGRPVLGIGIGINFGEVFAGNIGSNRRLEYTVIGDAVNTASRLCSSAGPNEILHLGAVLPEAQGPTHGRGAGAGAGEGKVEAGAGLPR